MDKMKQMQALRQAIETGSGEKGKKSQHDKGKQTARERIVKLFDSNTFVEIDAFVKHRNTGFSLDKQTIPCDGVITGYGQINGRIVYAYFQDFSAMGGSLGEMHANKICKVLDAAAKIGAPVIAVNDSGGARIQEGIDALNGYGNIFFRNSKYSGVIPQISVIMGPCAGGAAYSPALTDFIIMVDKTSQMFITGPSVIESVTGEKVSAEDLGGAMSHNSRSGNAHYFATDEANCLEQIKELLSFLPSNNTEKPPFFENQDNINRVDTALDALIPESPKVSYDMYSVIHSLVDNSHFYEYQKYFATNIITGFARFDGQSVGIVASQPMVMAGCLDINASDKAARFIRTCDAFNIPILTIADVPGFLPGTSQEYGGIIRHGAKMLHAYSEASVPLVTLITRKAYGGAYIAMCSKSLGCDVALAWPQAEIAVMGAEGAINLLYRKELKKAKEDGTNNSFREDKIQEYNDSLATPYIAAERGYIDDIIEPSQSRKRIIDAFAMLAGKRETKLIKKHNNMPL